MTQQRQQGSLRNGDNGSCQYSGARLREDRAGVLVQPLPEPKGHSFSAADTRRHGCEQRMMLALMAMSLGTTGAMVLHGLARKLQDERQSPVMSGTFDYLMVDAAAPQPGMDSTNFCQIPGGIDGSGTDPHRGQELFFTHANYQQLRSTLNNRVLGLMHAHAELVTQGPRQAMDFVLVTGNGGTSGGSLDRALGLLHDVAQDRHIEEARVHVVFIGAEISLRDKDRQVTVEQQSLVRSTAAGNLRKILADMAQDGIRQESRPDGTMFSVKAAERVWSVTLADQSNGFADHATVAELAHMLSEALYLRFFTQAGAYLAERICDLRRLGVLGLGNV